MLYIERCFRAQLQMADGNQQQRDRGTPQGAVVRPLFANLFLHYTFDRWMIMHCPHIPFEMYADDCVAHCRSGKQAEMLRDVLDRRFADCGLGLHPLKTRIIYCKDDDRREEHVSTDFDFLGYTFRPRRSKNRYDKAFINFSPGGINKVVKAIQQEVRGWKLHLLSDKTLEGLGRMFNAIIRGWIVYFAAFYKSG